MLTDLYAEDPDGIWRKGEHDLLASCGHLTLPEMINHDANRSAGYMRRLLAKPLR